MKVYLLTWQLAINSEPSDFGWVPITVKGSLQEATSSADKWNDQSVRTLPWEPGHTRSNRSIWTARYTLSPEVAPYFERVGVSLNKFIRIFEMELE